MQFNETQLTSIKNYCQRIIERPLPRGVQKWVTDGKHCWCEDWEAIEICKYLFNGREAYIGDPPPNRLKDNPLWSKEEIMAKGEQFISYYRSFSARDLTCKDAVLQGVGRGMLVLIASIVEPAFESIKCYDTNPAMLKEIRIYFHDRLLLPVETFLETANAAA